MNPLFILASCLLTFGLSAHATEILRITDGATAKCDSRADEMRYKTSFIYRPISAVRLNGQEALLSLQFLKCSQEERGGFAFSAETDLRSRTVVLERGPFRDQDMTVTVERNNLSVVVYNEEGHVFDSAPLKKISGDTYTAVIKLEEDNLLFNIHSMVKVTNENTGAVIDSGRDISGSYRIKLK